MFADVFFQALDHCVEFFSRSPLQFSGKQKYFWRQRLDLRTTAMAAACPAFNRGPLIHRILDDAVYAALHRAHEGDDRLFAGMRP